MSLNAIAAKRRAYGKIRCACEQTPSNGFAYLWVDTLLRQQYKQRRDFQGNKLHVCLVPPRRCAIFLSERFPLLWRLRCHDLSRGLMAHTRLHPLQELIALENVVCYVGNHWLHIGDRYSFSKDLERITWNQRGYSYRCEILRNSERG